MTTTRRGKVPQQSFVFECTQACNHDCLYCYNVWRAGTEYPRGQLPTLQTLDILDKMIQQTGASLVSLSGGEPLLRPDILQIVDHLLPRVAVNLLTNGSRLDEEMIHHLASREISLFEIPLLSFDRPVHDRLCGMAGAFDRVTLAIGGLKAAGRRVVGVFVATSLNLPAWRQTAELAVALGVDGIMFNRFNPGGASLRHVAALQATPQRLAEALDVAQQIIEDYGVPISCSIPMPPCLFDRARWPKLNFGFCSAGTERAYYTLDPLGNVRPCNHSPTILGNIQSQSFDEMTRCQTMARFASARPAFCGGCRVESECLGGCKASAEVCFGSIHESDPFMRAFSGQAHKLE